MPRWIAKLANDAYVEWSTVVDAPVSFVLTRDQAVDVYGADRVERADAHIISVKPQDPDDPVHLLYPESPESFVAGNRAGHNEAELTLAEILREYGNARDQSSEQGANAPASAATNQEAAS